MKLQPQTAVSLLYEKLVKNTYTIHYTDQNIPTDKKLSFLNPPKFHICMQ